MCFCCCFTRLSILVYLLVINILFVIFGIATIDKFGSDTPEYKAMKIVIDYGSLLKSDSSYSVLKKLEGIEHGLGGTIFAFCLIFIGVEILLIIYSCGEREYTTLKDYTYKIFNIILIVSMILSSIFIILSALYAILLLAAGIQYQDIRFPNDKCYSGIIIGYLWGIYGCYFFIYLCVGFCVLKTRFDLVGSDSNPGVNAKYLSNGQQIQKKPDQVVYVVQGQQYPQVYPVQNPIIAVPIYQNEIIPGQLNQPIYGIENSERNQFNQEKTNEEKPNNKGTGDNTKMTNNNQITDNDANNVGKGEGNEHKRVLGNKN